MLKEINPEDPAKYDYVLSRPAIMDYCTKKLEKCKCNLCPLVDACKKANVKTPPPRKPLTSPQEQKILEKFLKIYTPILEIDQYLTEYPLGNRAADLVFHTKECTWWVAEIEEELNYTAIGQAITYRKIYKELRGKRPKAAVICRRAPRDLKEACEVDVGIMVILV